MVEIYGLYDPDTGALRYVGKAKSAAKRFKTHLLESKTGIRPVNHWFRKLISAGKLPSIGILEVVKDADWKEAETRLIAVHRKTSTLLNLADGGDNIPMTAEQRKKNGISLNRKLAEKSPQMLAYIKAKQNLARLATTFKKQGDIFRWRCLRMHMHREALRRPDLCGEWLLHDL